MRRTFLGGDLARRAGALLVLFGLVAFFGPAPEGAQAKKKPTGTLTVQVKGLAGGTSAKVTVQGKRYQRKITNPGRTVLKRLRLGRYSVKAKAVSVGGSQASPVKSSFSVVISKKKRKGAVTVLYRQTPPPPVTFALSVTKSGDGSGTITSTPAGIDCGSDCFESFDQGTQVTLTAAAAAGSTFTGWSGSDCSGTGSCEVTMSEARSVSAGFAVNPTPPPTTHQLSVTKSGDGSGTITSTPAGIDCGSDCSESFDQGTQVTLTAAAAAGSTFTGWSGSGCSGTGSCEVTMSEARSVSAGFGIDALAASTISAGAPHTCAIRQSGQAVCWGRNNFGQLGNGTNDNSNVPVNVSGLEDAAQISAGDSHTCAIRQSGQAVCWGRNLFGQLGDGAFINSNVPVNVSGLEDAAQISAGDSYTCAIRQSGQAVCWGWNGDGQLGNGTNDISNVPVSVSGLDATAQISAGQAHTCAIRQSGQAVCWGLNNAGQLGNGTSGSGTNKNVPVDVSGLSNATRVSAGASHTCAIYQAGGQPVCWGGNETGQLGNGTTIDSNVPVSVLGVDAAAQISAGGYHTCAIRQSGQAVCWGWNLDGQLGDGTNNNSIVPVSVSGLNATAQISAGQAHTCAIRQSGRAVCWGWNFGGQLGDGTNTGSNAPVNVLSA